MTSASARALESDRDQPPSSHPWICIAKTAVRRPIVTRRKLQIALAAFWLLDGALQLQPFMFTRGFADHVIAPAAVGQPALVASAVHWATSVILVDPPLFDALFATVQLTIGTALLFRRTVRPGIVVSVGWVTGVWVLGEGLGGIAGGTASFLTGAPGAVLLYAVLGFAAWPRLGEKGREALLTRSSPMRARARALLGPADDERPARWVPAAWTAVWGLFALLRTLPANDSTVRLAGQLRENAPEAPRWLAEVEHSLSLAVTHDGVVTVIVVIVAELAIALGAFWGRVPRRIAGVSGVCFALAVWVFGQGFGQIPTGMGTDPNSAPLVALLGVALLGCAARASADVDVSRARTSSHRGTPAAPLGVATQHGASVIGPPKSTTSSSSRGSGSMRW